MDTNHPRWKRGWLWVLPAPVRWTLACSLSAWELPVFIRVDSCPFVVKSCSALRARWPSLASSPSVQFHPKSVSIRVHQWLNLLFRLPGSSLALCSLRCLLFIRFHSCPVVVELHFSGSNKLCQKSRPGTVSVRTVSEPVCETVPLKSIAS